MERRVPFQEHVGQLSLSVLRRWERTALKLHSCYCYSNEPPAKKKKEKGRKKNDVCMNIHTHSHAAKAYLQCLQEVKQSSVVVGVWSRSSRVWDRGPDVSQGFSQGMGWNGKIIKRVGRREPRGGRRPSHTVILGVSLRVPQHSPRSHCT